MDLKNKLRLSIKPNTYFYLALLLFFVPLPWLAAWFIAVCSHELFHIVAVRLCGGEISRLDIGIGGMDMETSPLSERKRLIAILSGPAGGLLLVFLGRWLPKTALCSWMLSVYNLLPLLPLDGGRALEILLDEQPVFLIVEKVFLILLAVLALYSVMILKLGILPVAIVAVLWARNRKIPCKEGICKVQ